MSTPGTEIHNVIIKNSIDTKAAKVRAISSCIGIDNDYKTREWTPMCDTMNSVCFGIVDNKPVFIACSVPADTTDSKLYAFLNNTNEPKLLAHITGDSFTKVLVHNGIIIAITSEGKILKMDNIDCHYDSDTIKFDDFPERVVDAEIISNTLWILTPTKLYQIDSTFDEMIPTDNYPAGIDMTSIVPAINSDDVIIYTNTSELPMFIRYQISSKKFSAFTSAIPFTIVNAILIGGTSPVLYTYNSDTKIRTLVLKDDIGFFDFNSYQGYQWVGKCVYYDGLIYNQWLDLSTGSPKLFLGRSINGIAFQLISEDFDYCDETYGKYCQGAGYSVFITPTMYKIKTPYIYGIDYSRYSNMVEIKDLPCVDKNENVLKFKIPDTYCTQLRAIDTSMTFVNLKINGVYVVSAKLMEICVNDDAFITVYTENSDIINSDDINGVSVDMVTKQIR